MSLGMGPPNTTGSTIFFHVFLSSLLHLIVIVVVEVFFRLKSYEIYISDYRVYVMGSFKRLVNFLNK